MSHPYREAGCTPVYPKLNPPTLEPPYGRTYGCRCCSFGEHLYSFGEHLYNFGPLAKPLPLGRAPHQYRDIPYPEIEYGWCVNCLSHYKDILNKFELSYTIQDMFLMEDSGDAWWASRYQSGLAGLGRLVWYGSTNDIAILEHVVHNYHIPLIRTRAENARIAEYNKVQWQTKQSHMKTFLSLVLSSIMRLKKVLGLK